VTTEIAALADLLGLFPPGSRVDLDGELVVGGCRLADLAATWSTPLDAGVGLIVIDNTDDIDRLESLVRSEQPVLIRVIPGVRPDTHEAVATGQLGSMFGLPIPAARSAIARLRQSSKVRLDGLHMHIGSQILQTEPYARAIEAIAGLGEFATYNLGGGLGVRYTYDDHPRLPGGLDRGRDERDAPPAAPWRADHHRAGAEPDRPVRGDPVPGDFGEGATIRFVAVDGGMADNMEVALYGQRFEATVASRVGGGTPVELVGRHGESGDRLISGAVLRDPW